MNPILAAAVASALLAQAAAAQQVLRDGVTPTVRATAEATVSARPDRARIHIGVVTQAATAQAAAADNARQLDTVLASLRRVMGPGAALRTVGYSVSPKMRYPREGGAPTITGYTATNTIEATVDDLKIVPRVIDTATQFGANSVQSLAFMLRDETSVRVQALRQAALQARSNAEAMAAALSLRVVRVLGVEESETARPRPLMREMALSAAAPGAPTPVEPGTVEMRAAVTVILGVE